MRGRQKEPLLSLPRNAAEGRVSLRTPRVDRSFAVFLDICGYTPFAESVIKDQGERGIGQLVDALEEIFEPIAGAALRNGGNIISVEGDAMLITFTGLDGALGFCGEAHPMRKVRARSCGRERSLQVDVGLAEGRLYEFIAEDGGRRAYIASGSALREASRLEKLSRNGSIASNMSRDIRGKSTDAQTDGEALHKAFLQRKGGLLRRLFSREHSSMPEPDPEYSASFFPAEARTAGSRLLSPVIIFSDFPLIRLAFSKINPPDGSKPDFGLAREALDEFFAGVRRIIEVQAEGFIGKFKDQNSLFLIGAPNACPDSRARAFESVAKVHSLHAQLCAKYGFPPHPAVSGMHKGEALCGNILGRYDAIGESVNLASRVKASLKNGGAERRKIRFTKEMLDERASRTVRGFEIERRRLEGIEETKTVFFDFSTVVGFGGREEFVLRKKELAALSRMLDYGGGAINVLGGAGSGRDRLVSLLASNLGERRIVEVRCSPLCRKEPYRALFELVKRAGGLFTDRELMESARGAQFSGMLDGFGERLLMRPSVYLINNGENIDAESAEFLGRLSPRLEGAGCVMVFSGPSRIFSAGRDFTVGELEAAEAEAFAGWLAKKHHPGSPLPKKALGEVLERSGGNPQSIAEMVKAMEEDELGRLRLPRKLPHTLKEIMLGNVHRALSPELQDALARYSLMHSVALMAPLCDAGAESSMAALRDKGFLGEDLEFSSEMLRRAVSESVDPRRKQEISLSLARAAEEAGMDDDLAVFGYYGGSERTRENRAKALAHAERHVGNVAFFYLVRNEFFDDAIALADLSDDEQRRICGSMLYRKAYLLSKAGNDMKTMEMRLDILEEALEYLDGTGEDHKVLAQMAATQCKLGRMLHEEESDRAESERRLTDGKRLFRMAMEEALRAGRVDCFISYANSFAGNLAVLCREPGAAMDVLGEAESRLAGLPPLEPTPRNLSYLAMMDKMYAEAAKEMGMTGFALEKLASALEKSERAGYAQGVLYCRATEAQVYLNAGDDEKAVALAEFCMDYMSKQGLEDAEVRADMDEVLKRARPGAFTRR